MGSAPPAAHRRTARDGGSTAPDPGHEPGGPAAEPPGGQRTERFRRVVTCVVTCVVVGYLASFVVALLAGLTAGRTFAPEGAALAAVPVWWTAHQVPIEIGGAPLGVLPLVPTVAVLALNAAAARRATRALGGRWREDAAVVVAAVGGTTAAVAALSTVVSTAVSGVPAHALPGSALLGGGLVAGLGALIGAAGAAGAPSWWAAAPEWARRGVGAARSAGAVLLAEGTLVLSCGLALGLGEARDRILESPSFGAGAGVVVLSLCYLPNAVAAGVSWLAGPGVSVGAAAASPLFLAPGPVPPLPLLAAFPQRPLPGWAAAVFALPVLAGVITGLRCRSLGPRPIDRLHGVAVAAVVTGSCFGLVAAVAGGRLAAGPFDPVVLPAWPGAAAVAAWVGLPALITVLLPRFSGREPRRRSTDVAADPAEVSVDGEMTRSGPVAESDTEPTGPPVQTPPVSPGWAGHDDPDLDDLELNEHGDLLARNPGEAAT